MVWKIGFNMEIIGLVGKGGDFMFVCKCDRCGDVICNRPISRITFVERNIPVERERKIELERNSSELVFDLCPLCSEIFLNMWIKKYKEEK